ncbi:RNA polymerase sigma factor [Bryobacter aggregatus]|uniref:RNA polymerase sigma factor n=1 Tax=Bryobacter aggregatus TaxID=360054 RepID=UPI00055CC80C|nr:sigma-70 family RNA polymerase sigma factor [Bryobacter aggregatus]
MFEISAPIEVALAANATPSFEDWMQRYQALVFRTAWRMLGSPADAEDVSQEVFLRLHQSLRSLPAEQPLSAWLYRVTVNLCLDQIRRRKPLGGELELLVSLSPSPEEQHTQQQRESRLARLIARLPERERACLILRDLEGLNSREVAVILECSEENVRSAIHRAKEKLKLWMS